MARHRKPPSATWRAFFKNHIRDIVAVDFFVVPTVRNQIFPVLLILAHERRRALHLNVTAYSTAERTAQQIVEAFPRDEAPRFLLRDRDGVYGESQSLLRLLPSLALSSLARDGLPGEPGGPPHRAWTRKRDRAPRRTTSSLRTRRGLIRQWSASRPLPDPTELHPIQASGASDHATATSQCRTGTECPLHSPRKRPFHPHNPAIVPADKVFGMDGHPG